METTELKEIFQNVYAIIDTSLTKDEIYEQVKQYESEILRREPIEVRREKFIFLVHNNLTEFFKQNKEQLDLFISYWTEVKEGGIKMRYEKEKKYYLKARMNTWHKNYQKFGAINVLSKLNLP